METQGEEDYGPLKRPNSSTDPGRPRRTASPLRLTQTIGLYRAYLDEIAVRHLC